MAFDVQVWRERLSHRLMGWRDRWEQARSAGVSSLYAFLSAMALWPVVEAYQQAHQQSDLAAIMALGGVLGSVGGNLLANKIQSWKDEVDAARELGQEVQENEGIRVALDAVMGQLEVMAQARAGLDEPDRAWFAETLREELSHLGNLAQYRAVLIGSGAIAQGPGAVAAGERGVAAGRDIHGPVVTGDHSRAVQAETFIEKQEIHPDPERARVDQARLRYFKRLYQQCNVLPLGAMGGDETTGDEVTLEQVYVALNTRTQVPISEEEKAEARPEAMFPGREMRLLTALETASQNRRLVLLGDPGSGKSTFVKQLAAWLVAVQLGQHDVMPGWEPKLVPVLVILRELSARLAGLALEDLPGPEQERRLVEIVRQHWQEELEACRSGEWVSCLEDALIDGNVLLIFDGLDEVPKAFRGRVRQAVQALLHSYSDIRRVIVTCRIRSYAGEAVLSGFDQHTLAPFDQGQIEQFVGAWYNAQFLLGRMNETRAKENARDLQRAALSADLRELASNPMLLTTMAIIHQREVGLPRERVRLYSLAVQILLSRWQVRKGILVSEALGAVLRDDLKLRAILERLAYEVHVQQAQQDEAVDLLRKDLLVLLEDPTYLGDVGLAGEFLDYVDQRAGLLVGHGGGEATAYPHAYRFPHRTFQEYLAGCHMVGRRGTAREYWRRAAEGDTWYLAALLGAEELLYNRRSPKDLLDLAYDLCPDRPPAREDEAAWRVALWSGHMATQLGADEVKRDTERSDGGETYLARLVPRLIGILRQSPLGAIERADAGNTLAQLADPRFRNDAWYLPDEPLLGFVEVPEGSFVMGTREADVPALLERFEGEREWYEWEVPQHEMTLPAYYVARYPVTVAQFSAFADAGGYQEPRHWREAESAGQWKDGRVRGAYVRSEEGEVKVVEEWREGPVRPGEMVNHPVVDVTWYETLAYCRWLEERLREWGGTPEPLATLLREQGWTVTLPSEAEWERVARGTDGRLFPWGDEPDPDRANYGETGIGATSAVGCFPGGASPYGVEDLSGNVWEWTRSLWGRSWEKPGFGYPYDPSDGREDLGAGPDTLRVLRGGSFVVGAGVVRCAYRDGYVPYARYGNYGFRVIVASPVHL